MTVKQISTLSCDACGTEHITQGTPYSMRVLLDWAEIDINWVDSVDGENHYDLWHLCPPCSGDLLAAIVKHRQEAAGYAEAAKDHG